MIRRNMKFIINKLVLLVIVLGLFIYVHSSVPYQVVSIEGGNIQINIGSDDGITIGFTGKIFYYYKNMKTGIKEQINIASFRVESVEKNRCRARILEKKQNIEIGFWVSFDKALIVKKDESPKTVTKPSKLEPAVKPPVQKVDKSTNQKMDLAFWESIKDSKNPDDYQAYLNKFPKGTFAELAQNRIKDSKRRGEEPSKKLDHRSSSYFSIQVGVYADFSNAKKESEKFLKLGYQTCIEVPINNKKILHRLYVGKFENINEAEKVKEILEELLGRKYRIVQPPIWKNSLFVKTDRKKKALDSRNYTPAARLRSDYRSMSIADVKAMLEKRGFYNSNLHNSKTFWNQFEKKHISGSPVVIDKATGLMWQQAGSIKSPSPKFKAAEKWIEDLNRQGYAGYHDWRIPSLEEGASLLESNKRNGELYIDPLFSKEQSCIWTGDQFSKSKAWVVNFFHGNVHRSSLRWPRDIRAVRSDQ